MKKKVQTIGNVCVVIALLFIARYVVNLNFDYKTLLKNGRLLWIALVAILYTVGISTLFYPWKLLVEGLSQKKLLAIDVYQVYAKANLYKYLPGNVFHYVGRQALAARAEIEHKIVALSTALDIILTVAAGILLAVVFLGNYVFEQILQYGSRNITGYVLIGAAVLATILGLAFFFKNSVQETIRRFRTMFTAAFVKCLLKAFLIYIVFFLFYVCCYLIILALIFHLTFNRTSLRIVGGALTFSWVAGFLVPGAPGGLGIREVVMLSIMGGVLDEGSVAVSMVLFRVVTVLSDVMLYFSSVLIEKYRLLGRKIENWEIRRR